MKERKNTVLKSKKKTSVLKTLSYLLKQPCYAEAVFINSKYIFGCHQVSLSDKLKLDTIYIQGKFKMNENELIQKAIEASKRATRHILNFMWVQRF